MKKTNLIKKTMTLALSLTMVLSLAACTGSPQQAVCRLHRGTGQGLLCTGQGRERGTACAGVLKAVSGRAGEGRRQQPYLIHGKVYERTGGGVWLFIEK